MESHGHFHQVGGLGRKKLIVRFTISFVFFLRKSLPKLKEGAPKGSALSCTQPSPQGLGHAGIALAVQTPTSKGRFVNQMYRGNVGSVLPKLMNKLPKGSHEAD